MSPARLSNSSIMARLIGIRGPVKGNVYALGTERLIAGRGTECHVLITGAGVSREHAYFEQRGDTWAVVDNSKNGIAVNGLNTRDQVLEQGDEVAIGPAELVFDPPWSVGESLDPEAPLVALAADADDARYTVQDAVAYHDGSSDSETDTVAFSENDTGALRAASQAITKDAPAAAAAAAPAVEPAEAERHYGAMVRVAKLIERNLAYPKFLSELNEIVGRSLNADNCVVLLERGPVGGASQLMPLATFARSKSKPTVPVSQTVLSQVQRDRRALRLKDVAADARFRESRSVIDSRISAILCAPIIADGAVRGAIYASSFHGRFEFSASDLRHLVALATLAGPMLLQRQRIETLERQQQAHASEVAGDRLILGSSPAIAELRRQLAQIAKTDSTILIRGETGTGKELAARAIHDSSHRHDGPFVSLNCAAISESLLESELFGHEKGAFTGAESAKPGRFELADGGTIFLDEIGDVPAATQTKLLRVLEERAFVRVGGVQMKRVDVRIIAATNRDLESAVRANEFRKDLYFRLNVVPLTCPPLRERDGDLDLLINAFAVQMAARLGRRAPLFAEPALERLRSHPWTGNIRELKNTIERILVTVPGETVDARDLPPLVAFEAGDDGLDRVVADLDFSEGLAAAVAKLERLAVTEALRKSKGKKVDAAKYLRISRPTLDKKISDLGIEL
jgi:Nif-specific regulatory protein